MPMTIAVSVASHTTGSWTMPSAISSVVEQPVALQDVDPGIDADQERGQERQEHRHDQDRLQAARHPRDAIGDRIADQQQDRRRQRRDREAAQIGRQIEPVGAEQLDSCRATAPATKSRKPGQPAARSSTGT